MARTPSNMLPLGTIAPDFCLPDVVSQNNRAFNSIRGKKGTVIAFLCNHCPYVKHINEALVNLAKTYQPLGIAFAGISSNDVLAYPEDGPKEMIETAALAGYNFPYLYDASQKVAKAFNAACTPDFYLFDASDKLVYRGQLDNSRPGNMIPVSGADLERAMTCLIENLPIPQDQKPSMGCNIKWKPNT
ncbi:MAG: hypothetical protein RLZZ241_1914 [Bacteroidota bacterium]|jgi:thiol-disulfide isomerase/thioredoxin